MPTYVQVPRHDANLLHPIVFFEQGTEFFELRQQFDGDWLLRQYFARQLERECADSEELRDELERIGVPPLNALQWNSERQSYTPYAAGTAVPPEGVAAHAAPSAQCSTLVLDPLASTRRLSREDGRDLRVIYPLMEHDENTAFRSDKPKFYAYLKYPPLTPGAWACLALLDPYEQAALADAVGPLKEAPRGMSSMEWRLRHAFSDDLVRSRGMLAAQLARLPMLFAEVDKEGEVTFEFDRIPRGDYGLSPKTWMVIVLDMGANSEAV